MKRLGCGVDFKMFFLHVQFCPVALKGGSKKGCLKIIKGMNVNLALQELEEVQRELNAWHAHTTEEIRAFHSRVTNHIQLIEESLGGKAAPVTSLPPATASARPQAGGKASSTGTGALDWETLLTPSKTQQTPQRGGAQQDTVDATPSMASPPVSHALNYDVLIEDVERERARRLAGERPLTDNELVALRTRPTPESIPAEAHNVVKPTDRTQPCQVLVEFKRKRVLQFESSSYVAPGEFVVVGGDRGEDIGLVTHTWLAGSQGNAPANVSKWAGVGLGKVLRVATVLEVSQLQGVQTELEMRAVEVAQEKVQEHMLPMRIVDAEYQFDRKKLTFYYQSQHRLDFRNLVRDLYKTFRARIWMEQD